MKNKVNVWRIPQPNPALQEIFSLKLGISKIVAQIMINRGITTLEDAKAFLYQDTFTLHDPMLMKDMDKALDRIISAVKCKEKIRIFGDYDVDGITSTALMAIVLKQIGANVDYYIPERLTEGYGMNKEAVRNAHQSGVSLIITVDSGITAWDEVDYAKGLGLDVIITDHHEPSDRVPNALAVLNPKQVDCIYPFKDLAGVGVAFRLGQAILANYNLDIPDRIVELVCLGTIADIVRLKGENRIIVKRGLTMLPYTKSVGMRALLQNCGVTEQNVTSAQIAFQLAPRLNAAGRLGDASIGVKLLLTDDIDEANELAAEMCNMNVKRQEIEDGIYKAAIGMIQAGGHVDLASNKVIVLAGENWHLGVIGIVASKLVQEYYRPVVLLAVDGDIARGSARSIPSLNIFEAFKANEVYLERYGGHAQAAGLTITTEKITEFRKALNDYANEILREEDLVPELLIDSEIALAAVNGDLQQQLDLLAPHGFGNPSPVLVARNSAVLEHKLVGSNQNHLKMKVGNDERYTIDAIGFNLAGYQPLLTQQERFDLVFALEKNEWRGRTSIQLNLKDLRPVKQQEGVLFNSKCESQPNGKNDFVEELFQKAISYLKDDFYRDIGEKEEFYTKVVGVTFEDRQEVVATLCEGEKLLLVRERENIYDQNAVRVENQSGQQLGYLNARLAKHFAPLLDRGEAYNVNVSQVTGGLDKNYGVNIIIQKALAADSAEELVKLQQMRENLSSSDDKFLWEQIREALLGSYPYRDKQSEAIQSVIDGLNTLAIFGTGRGKSAVFQSAAAYKALRNGEMTVIIYPLRALVNDQYENMSVKLKKLGLRVYKGNGSISAAERAELFEAIENRTIDVLLTTPEFITHHAHKVQIAGIKVGLFVVDESHHIGMSSASHRPIYKKLNNIVEMLNKPNVLAVTATADDIVADEIIRALDIKNVVIDPFIRTNLNVIDQRNILDKNRYLKELVKSGDKTIIYVNSRIQTVELAAMLRQEMPEMAGKIIYYHAGLNSGQRNTIEKMFRSGNITTVVSTSAFGEGIDIPDVRNVVVFHLNFNFTEFNQQCGRCGRDGSEAFIHLLCGRRDARINKFILETSAPDRDALAALYKAIKELSDKSSPVTATNDDIAKLMQKNGLKYARPQLVSMGLGILEELNLLYREVMGRNRQIFLMPAPGNKLNLEHSLRFSEGQEEIKTFQEFHDFFFASTPEELLNFINKPIYPAKYLSMPSNTDKNCAIINN